MRERDSKGASSGEAPCSVVKMEHISHYWLISASFGLAGKRGGTRSMNPRRLSKRFRSTVDLFSHRRTTRFPRRLQGPVKRLPSASHVRD